MSVTVRTQTALTQADELMGKLYEKDVIVTSAYFGDTSRHIQKRTGFTRSVTKKFLAERLTNAGSTATLEADARTAQAPMVDEVEITRTYLRRLDATIQRSILADTAVSGNRDAVFKLASELAMEALQSLDEKENQLLNQNSKATKATIVAKYDTKGSTYSTATTAVFALINGGVAQFSQGEVLDVRNSNDSDAVIAEVQVQDVFHDTKIFGNDLTYPSICVKLTAATGMTANDAGNLDSVEVGVVGTGDKLCHQDDGTGAGFDAGFQGLVDLGATPGTYFGVNRNTVSNRYLLPYGRDYDTDGDGTGTAQALSLDTIFDDCYITMGRMINPTRRWLRNNNYKFSDAIVMQVPPALAPSISRHAGRDNQRFTVIEPSSLSEAQRRKLIAVRDFDGVVIRTTLPIPPVAIQIEPLMPPDTVRIWEPGVFEWLQLGNNSREPQWLRNDAGGRWHVKRSASTGNLQVLLDAFCWRIVAPFCAIPRLVWEGRGLAA